MNIDLKFSFIKSPQVFVLHAKCNTGVILNKDFQIWQDKSESPLRIFNSLEEAINYFERSIRPLNEIECVIYDDHHQFIKYLSPI